MITVLVWVVGIVAFLAMLLYAGYVISSPIPPRVPRVVQYIMLPFCYIFVIILTCMDRDWKAFKSIHKWKF